ncbi:lipase family protein [Nocardioides fonticola]|uniref:Lipase family protein n=2 Tax=Nocardioides fonticola TaxID=450363 RepID=A0ABP7XC08_9ACTN
MRSMRVPSPIRPSGRSRRGGVVGVLAALAAVAALLAVPAAPVQARAGGLDDPFYDYTGSTPLADLAPGTVLNTRTVPYSIQGLPLPITATQLLYRTEDALGRPVVNATTVVKPLVPLGEPKVLSYQSFYDSLNPADQPSTVIAGGQGLGAGNVNVETLIFAPALLAGFTINIPDTQGQQADFAAGPEYGVTTIDSLRAISRSDATGVGTSAKIGLLGYSGGAIASEWAAELVAERAPAIARRIVGTAIGGVLVKPSTNLHYISGSQVWAGVAPMALVGIARAYDLDLSPYVNARGRAIMKKLQNAPISQVLGFYPGLTWTDIAKKRYPTPESVPVYVRIANQLIMSTGGTPTSPMFIGQGTGGELEGTAAGGPGIGKGDGVMVAGDVRSLARRYCDRGVTLQYRQYPLSHFTTVALWLPEAYGWLLQRFAGVAAPSSCGSIAAGNSLAPISVER